MLETQDLKTNTKLIPPKDIEFISVEVEDCKTLNSMIKHFDDRNTHYETAEGIAWSLLAAFLSSYVVYLIQFVPDKDNYKKLFWATICHAVLMFASIITAFICGQKVKKQKTTKIVTKKCIQDLLKSITEKTNIKEMKKNKKADSAAQNGEPSSESNKPFDAKSTGTPDASTVIPALESDGEQ